MRIFMCHVYDNVGVITPLSWGKRYAMLPQDIEEEERRQDRQRRRDDAESHAAAVANGDITSHDSSISAISGTRGNGNSVHLEMGLMRSSSPSPLPPSPPSSSSSIATSSDGSIMVSSSTAEPSV
jgi:hypothetical protein